MGAPVRESDESEPSKNEPLKPEWLKNESSKNQPSKEQPKKVGAAPSSRATEVPEPPWKRKAGRGVFEGDVAAVALRSQLALGPERVPEPPVPVSNAPTFAAALRLMGGVLTAAAVAGVAGYLWGFRLSIKSPQLAPASDQADVQPAPSPAGSPDSDQADVLPAPSPAGSPAAAPSARVSSPIEGIERSSPIPPAPALAIESRERALAPQDKQRALDFFKKGEDLSAAGNVGAARLFYERAADAGLAEGALALAATFDPDEPARRQILGGVQPDRAAARRWYERARELGASEAENHLRRLGARNH